MGLVFHKLHITQNIVGVPNTLLYLQNVFKRYTLKECCALVFDTVLVIRRSEKNNVWNVFPTWLEVEWFLTT